jgi:hypothetical protein
MKRWEKAELAEGREGALLAFEPSYLQVAVSGWMQLATRSCPLPAARCPVHAA